MNKIEGIYRGLNRPVRTGRLIEAPQVYRVELVPERRYTKNGQTGQLTRVTHLRRLCDDVAVCLGVSSVRIVVNGAIWLEIPKPKRESVSLSSLLSTSAKLPAILGRSVDGNDLVLDLNDPSSPHILVAGTTGSGKSVCLKSVIAGILAKCQKVVVAVVDTKYELNEFADNPQVLIENTVEGAKALLRHLIYVGNERFSRGVSSDDVPWVVVVDEFADLVLQDSEIETLVVRLAQKVRAAGIHLIIATQRPTVDVVTGLIKANMPVRVSFRTVSKVDSKVVLDVAGAEKLQGKGDGLLMMNGELTRFQGAMAQ